MCRLMALSRPHDGPASQAEQFIFATMMCLSSRLGNQHGTGMSVNTASYDWLKSGQKAEKLVFTEPWNEWWGGLETGGYDTILGHTRLASTDWRAKVGEDYTEEHAHPHEFDRFSVFHNGIFKDYKKIAEKLDLDLEKSDLTDSGVFIRLLASHSQDGFNTKGLVGALKDAGEAEYSLFIQREGSQDVFVVRGNRSLFVVESNYGLLVNTTRINLTDLEDATKLGLMAFGHAPLELDTPKDLDDYTLYRLRHGNLAKIKEFGDQVKKINDPPRVVTGTSAWQGASSYGGASNTNPNTDTLDGDEIAARTLAMLELSKLLPKVHDEHHRLAMLELYGADDDKHPTLAHFESEQLKEYTDMMVWAQENMDLFAWDDTKFQYWTGFTKAAFQTTPEATTRDMYVEAAHTLGKHFDVPYFLNEVATLQELHDEVVQ